jgi:hypothetical protein
MSPVVYSSLSNAARGKSGKLNTPALMYSGAAVNAADVRRGPISADESIGQQSLQSGTLPVRLIVYAPASSGPSSEISSVGSDPHSPLLTFGLPFLISIADSFAFMYGWNSNLQFSGS